MIALLRLTCCSIRLPHDRTATLLLTALLLSLFTITLARPQDDDEPTSSISQVSAPFIDRTTGLPMERIFGARTQFGFAFALPTTAPATANTTSSFIGQISFPLVNGQGWGAMGLTGDMEGNFILAVWPTGNGDVMASFRQATNEDNPPEVTGSFSVRPIPDGTTVNQTFLSYTFLCEGCIDPTLGLSVQASGNAVMGWALSERPPRGNAATAQFDAIAVTALQPLAANRIAVPAVVGVAGAGSGDEGGSDDVAAGGQGGSGSDDEDDD
ncbi:hypothetical protein ACN47E_007574 [Coniothyrium glycines]